MAAYILGTEIMGEDLEELILNKTEGIPFFVEEFMKSLKDLGMIEWRDSGYYLAKDIQEVAIPSTIQEVIMARVDSLPDGAKSVLQTGSAIGREFSCELIKRVTGIPTPEMTPHLSVLRDSELLYERGIFPQATYIFRHSLTQEVAYDSLLLKRRREIHDRIGKAIEELYPDRLEEFYEILAHHYSKSENHEKAYQYLKLSGDKATRSNSPWEAFRFYKEAINVLTQLPDTEENKRRGIEVRLLMAGPLAGLAFPEDSLQILQEGEKLSKELGDERSLAKFYSNMGIYYSVRGDTLQGIKYAEKALEEAEKTQDVDLAAHLAFDIFVPDIVAGRFFRICELAPGVIALIEKAQRESEAFGKGYNVYSVLVGYYGCATGLLGDFEEGEVLCEKALRFALEIRDLFSLAMVHHAYGWMFNFKGDGKNVVEHLQSSIRYSEELQFLGLLGHLNSGLGWGYHLLGEMETAREHAERAIKIQTDSGIPFLLSCAYHALSVLHLDSGDFEEARRCADEALRLSQNNNEKWAEGVSRMLLGRILGKADKSQFAEAEESILQGIEIQDELRLKPWSYTGYLYLGELYADTGQREKALEHLKKAKRMFQEMGMDYWLRRTQEVLERVEAA